MKYLISFLNVSSIKIVDELIEAGVYKVDDSLRVGDKSKFLTKVKDKVCHVESDADLSLLFNELKELIKKEEL